MKNVLSICGLILTLAFPISVSDGIEDNQPLIIFAASSTAIPLESIRTNFKNTHGGTKILTSFGASALLARQISQGAPADIFISANKQWVDWLIENRKIQHEPIIIARNRLAIVSNRVIQNDSCPSSPEYFTRMIAGKRFSIADPNVSPLGIYSKQALENLGLWDVVKNNLAIAGNANLALRLVEQGATHHGIVYASSAHQSKIIHNSCVLPTDSHEAINYYLLALKPSKKSVNSIIKFITDESTKYWTDAGFEIMYQNDTDQNESK